MAPSDGIAVTASAGGVSARTGDDATTLWPALLTAILLILIVQVGFLLRGEAPVLNGALIDPDGYMRLARVAELWHSGAWFDPVFPRIDPPAGLALHWTRPFDVLLLAGALPLAPFLGFDAGLFWWGALFGPLLQVAAVALMVWAAAPLLRRHWLCLLPFLFIAQPAIFGCFAVGRPDHHGLQILLLVLLIGFTIRLILDPARTRNAVWAGLISALDLWVSVEAVVPVALSIAALGLCWMAGERRALKALTMHAAVLCGALVVVLLAERGAGALSEVAFDRISRAHWLVFALNLAFWLALGTLERYGLLHRGRAARAAAASAAAVAVLAILWHLQPGLFANPMSNSDTLYMVKHMVHIEELQPAMDWDKLAAGEWREFAVPPLLWLGSALLAVPWLLYRLWRSSGRWRFAWIYLGLAALVFLPLGARQLRWAFYPELFLLVPYAGLAGTLLDRLARDLHEQLLGILRPMLMTLLCIWPFLPSALSDAGPKTGVGVRTARDCPIRDLAPLLNDSAGLGARSQRMLALIDFGPELLYRTGHAVLAIPNHRYQPGFRTGYRIMSASDPEAARQGLREAGIDLVLVCPNSAERWFYARDDRAPGFIDTLLAGEVPAFLNPVALPPDLAESFKLFAVRSTQGGAQAPALP